LAAAACPRRTFPNCPRLKRSLVYTPWQLGYTSGSTPREVVTGSLALSPDGVAYTVPATYREPLCLRRALPGSEGCLASLRRALPLLQRSYGLMRPTKRLSRTWFPYTDESLQVATSPCWRMVVPDVISAYLSLDAWTPTPAAGWVRLPISSPTPSAFPQSL
jgi:hypothetical protein